MTTAPCPRVAPVWRALAIAAPLALGVASHASAQQETAPPATAPGQTQGDDARQPLPGLSDPGQQQPEPAEAEGTSTPEGADLSDDSAQPAPAANSLLEPSAATGDAGSEGPHDWLPEAILLPEDMEIIINSAIGSSTRLLQFSTHEDAEALIATWRDQLREGGWQVDLSPQMIEDQQILFSGPGIGSAQVIIIPSQSDGAQVIQIDASLTNE
ncbi:hypothetical protein ACFQXB_04010 [Plastorhodobacter daqingensis]|uniref:Toxin co-regulated pilus biosynthesis protein Q C-terminal domain-containing protein n=1 Tax=Plastorhodobacter daqingensis TaxID=1387281 RepID=A0ABW2UJG0_9RHOB